MITKNLITKNKIIQSYKNQRKEDNKMWKIFTALSILITLVSVIELASATESSDELKKANDETIRELLDLDYDIDLYITSGNRWLGRDIYWNDHDKARIIQKNSGLEVHFEDWIDNDFNDVVILLSNVDGELKIELVDYETAAPDPVSLLLNFEETKKVYIEKSNNLDSQHVGEIIDLNIWSSVHDDPNIKKTATVVVEEASQEDLPDIAVKSISKSNNDDKTIITAIIENIGDVGVQYSRSTSVYKTGFNFQKDSSSIATDSLYIGPGEEQKYITNWNLDNGDYNAEVKLYTSVEEYSKDNNELTKEFQVEKDVVEPSEDECFWRESMNVGESVHVEVDGKEFVIVAEEADEESAMFLINGEEIKLEKGETKNADVQDIDIKLIRISENTPATKVIHRDFRSCLTDNVIPNYRSKAHQVMPQGKTYSDNGCSSMKESQCFMDNSHDTYYDNSCEFYDDPVVIKKLNFCLTGDSQIRYPDFKVESVEAIESDIDLENGVDVEVNVKNYGSKYTGELGVVIYSVDNLDKEVVYKSSPVYLNGLGSGETKTFEFKDLELKSDNYQFVAEVDFDNSVRETKDYDNIKNFNIKTTSPPSRGVASVVLSPSFNSIKEGDIAEYKITVYDYHKEEACDDPFFDDDCEKFYTYDFDIRGLPFLVNGLESITLEPGESKTVYFEVDTSVYENNFNSNKNGNSYRYGFTLVTSLNKAIVDKDSSTLFIEKEDLTPPSLPDSLDLKIKLNRGWNLVSIPGELVKFQKLESNDKLLGFIRVDDEYLSLKEANSELGSRFPKYLASHSFWVYSYTNQNLGVEVKTNDVRIDVEEGWNFVPISHHFKGHNLDFLKNGCDLTSAYKFDSKNQQWSKVRFSHKFKESEFGDGLIIKSKNSCSFITFTNDLVPPSLPEDSLLLENQAYKIKPVKLLSDLTIEVEVDDFSGISDFDAKLLIENNGDAAAKNIEWRIIGEKEDIIIKDKIKSLGPGESYLYTADSELVELLEYDYGKHIVIAEVDYENKIDESNYKNNIVRTEFYYLPKDDYVVEESYDD